MKRWMCVMAMALAMLVLLCACDEESAPPAENNAGNQGEQTAEKWMFYVQNGTNRSVSDFRNAFAGTDDWVDDLLSGGSLTEYEETIEIYSTDADHLYDFKFLTSGNYYRVDRVEVPANCVVSVVEGQDGIALQVFYEDSGYDYYLASHLDSSGEPLAEGTVEIDVVITNHTSDVLNEIYLAPNAGDSWGENLLREPLEAMGQFVYTVGGYVPNALYDVKLVDGAGEVHQIWAVQLEGGCNLEMALGQGGLGVLVQYPGGSHEYYMADTNVDYAA